MKAWALPVVGALLPFLFTSTLPSGAAAALLLLTLAAAFRRAFRPWCLLPLMFLVTTLAVNERLQQRFEARDGPVTLTLSGRIGDLPALRGESLRFLFLPDEGHPPAPPAILVSWFRGRADAPEPPPTPRAGEHWRLTLKLLPPRGRVNFAGSDSERWYFAQGIAALGYVAEGDNARLGPASPFDPNGWRETMLERLAAAAGDAPAYRVLAALAVADRRGLQASDRNLLAATGTGHLLAISGLHVGLAAALGFYLGRVLLALTGYRSAQRLAVLLPWLGAWSLALAYSALAAFGVSTRRALIMLTITTLVALSRRQVHPAQGWLVAMAVVLLADPFAPLRPGFWFSFLAVAVLLMVFVPRHGHPAGWRRMLSAQVAISLVMAPIGLYFFQQLSAPGLVANLVAIPVVSMIAVPLVLVAMPFLWLPGPVAGWLLTAAGHTMEALFGFLQWLSAVQPDAFAAMPTPGLVATMVAMLGAALFLLPRGVPGRFAGISLMLPLLAPLNAGPAEGMTRVDILDVGLGLSVLLRTSEYLLVYDTGPGNGVSGEGGWNLADSVILPMIRASGRPPDLVVASHGDLDHAGGFEDLRAAFANTPLLASFARPAEGVTDCRSPSAWRAGGLRLRVLHPSPGLPYLGNDSSCVLSARGTGFSMLLGGDMGHAVERRLAGTGLEPHALLVVPHHGSSGSSSEWLVDATKPTLALVSATAHNRFGFPRQDVVARYRRAGARVLNTADCGGVRVVSDRDGHLALRSARRERPAIWRLAPPPDCP